MTDDEQCPAVGAEEAHEPLLGVVVEVVGGFVEEEQVAAREQDAREFHAPPFTTGERVEGKVEPIVTESEPRGDGAHLGFGAVPAGVAELFFRAGVLRRVLLAPGLVDLDAELLHPECERVQALPRQHVGQAGGVDAGTARSGVLGEVADGGRVRHDPRGCGRFAGNHLEHRRLAGTVAADEPDGVSRVQ